MRRAVVVIATLAIPVAVVVALAFGLAACGDDGGAEPSPTGTGTVTASPTVSPTPSASPTGTMTVSVYLLRGETLGVAHRKVPATQAVATAAMTALLEGPNAREKAAGLTTTIPVGTTLNEVTIEDGTARVDLSGEFASGGGSLSMQARVAQVVYTLTQFPTVKSVEFLVDGEIVTAIGGEGIVVDGPQRRSDWAGLLPAIFVETPAVGDTVRSPLTARGTAMAFEATFVLEVLDKSGDVIAKKVVMATVGAPERGRFSARIPFSAGEGRIVLYAYEESMADGSRLNEVRIPLRTQP
jgi:germination protein M